MSNLHATRKCRILQGDCLEVMVELPDNSISACITDPPYNYEFIGRNWNHEEISRRLERIQDSSTLVKNIPYGSGLAGGVRNARWYERNRLNTLEYQAWCLAWGREVFRVSKPGGFVAVFSSSRTVGHIQVALEEAGFYARDILVHRRNAGIPKGLNIARKLAKKGNPAAEDWQGWNTCFRNEWEGIALLQKPLVNNYLETLDAHGVGVIKTVNGNGSFQSNILEGFSKTEEDNCEAHCTTKPLSLMRRLIEMLVPPGDEHVILDPFAGSGSTVLAAAQLGRCAIGIEIEPAYCELARERFVILSLSDTLDAQ